MIKEIEKKVGKTYSNMEGKKAKTFCLPDQNENKICLKSLLEDLREGGRVLFFFYPKDMTSGCTLEAEDFSKNKKKFEKLGVKVFGISKLDSKSKCKFIQKNNLKIDLLSDEDLKVCEKYNLYRDKNMYGKMVRGIDRETFLIGKDGKIQKH
jgi:peroxiredoxin Q/BCP